MNESILHIIRLYHQGEPLSAKQQQMLDAWLEAASYNREVLTLLNDNNWLRDAVAEREQYKSEMMPGWTKLQQAIAGNDSFKQPVTPVRQLGKLWWAAAAVVLLSVSIWRWYQTPAGTTPQAQVMQDVAPGHDGAVLTLSNGQQLVLGSLGNGRIALEDGTSLVLNDHELSYNAPANAQAGAIPMNALATPRGRQFRLVLPDGSRVWLNAASQLRYPAVFNGPERRVFLTGEAYFEVAANKLQPFKVEAEGNDIIVLGTGFNISAYQEDGVVKTTLVEGAVAVERNGQQKQLVPGQQAQVTTEGIMSVTAADISEVTAWKDNRFLYRSIAVADFLKIVARWYDIEIVYEKNLPQQMIWVNYSREQNLLRTLEILKNNGIKFQLIEKRLMIQP